MITLGDIVTQVLQRLALVEGLDAQIYAEPRIVLAVQHKFDILFREYWLPEYTTIQEEYTLDGSTGTITGDLSAKILDWRDLHSVFREGSHKPVPIAPMGVRHIDINYPCVVPNMVQPTKVFKLRPLTTTGKVWVTYRTYPATFKEDDDQIFLDTQLLLLGTCYDVLEDDGTNPGAADKFKALFLDALAQFNRAQHQIPLDTIMPTRSTVDRWT